MLADILQRAVGAVPDKSPAAVGAALLARRIAGVEVASDRHMRFRPLTQPNEATARVYAGLYRQYLARAALCE
jgi:sugar (pentulose or hexulose) kinase